MCAGRRGCQGPGRAGFAMWDRLVWPRIGHNERMRPAIVTEAMRALLKAEEATLSDYATGFVLLEPTPAGVPRAQLGGSGTLITVDNFEGILTASHVLELLDESSYVGLILPSQLEPSAHNVLLDIKHCRRFDFPPDGRWSLRPDMAFIVPPYDTLSTLKSKKVFYNLSKRRADMLERPPAVDDGVWILSGYSEEWTSDLPPVHGFKRGIHFRGMHGKGVIRAARMDKRGQFDYLSFGALYNDLYEGPDRYGGLSGGGLWQLLVRSEGERLVITDRVLSGVAFCQSRKGMRDEGEIRHIACHGRRSLYRDLIDRVRTQQG